MSAGPTSSSTFFGLSSSRRWCPYGGGCRALAIPWIGERDGMTIIVCHDHLNTVRQGLEIDPAKVRTSSEHPKKALIGHKLAQVRLGPFTVAGTGGTTTTGLDEVQTHGMTVHGRRNPLLQA